MKLKKLTLNAIAMEHSEMKNIKAGSDGEGRSVCFTNEEHTDCAKGIPSCTTDSGKKGSCYFEVLVDTGAEYHAKCYCA